MARPMSNPPPLNNALNLEEQSVASTIGHEGTSTSVGEIPTVISQITTSTVSQKMVVSLPEVVLTF